MNERNITVILINAIVNVHNIFFFKKKIVDYIKKKKEKEKKGNISLTI